MGMPSNRKRSARRPGRKERVHRKKHTRSGYSGPGYVPSDGHGFLYLGRKKSVRFYKWLNSHLLGESRTLVPQ